jgi:AcrR family transcriptional regulator
VLDAARQLLRERGIAGMTMDALAARAGVGKGTLYRGFGSRAGLAEGLADEAERALQERILTGPAPLGWGAPPDQRLQAFVTAYIDLLESDADLLVETERGAPGARFHTGAYAFWHTHVRALLRLLGRDRPDVRADALLAILSADLYIHLRNIGVSRPVIQAVLSDAATGS